MQRYLVITESDTHKFGVRRLFAARDTKEEAETILQKLKDTFPMMFSEIVDIEKPQYKIGEGKAYIENLILWHPNSLRKAMILMGEKITA